jgi:DNA end-binding protein Ku
MRSIKKGSLHFGLLNIPVKAYVATDDHDVHFHMHHGACLDKPEQGAISMPRVCKDCGQKVNFSDIVSGKDVDGTFVIVTDEEKNALIEEQDPGFEVLEFVNRGDVDPILFEKTHTLDPEKGAEKVYLLLLNDLSETDRVGIVQFTMSQKTHIGVLGVFRHEEGDVLAIHTLRWVDEVRGTAELTGSHKKVTLIPAEIEMMRQAIDSRVGVWNPGKYVDTYTERLTEFVETKADGGEFVPLVREDVGTADVSDLLAMLQASVKKAA